ASPRDRPRPDRRAHPRVKRRVSGRRGQAAGSDPPHAARPRAVGWHQLLRGRGPKARGRRPSPGREEHPDHDFALQDLLRRRRGRRHELPGRDRHGSARDPRARVAGSGKQGARSGETRRQGSLSKSESPAEETNGEEEILMTNTKKAKGKKGAKAKKLRLTKQ